MLSIFHKAFSHPPKELNNPVSERSLLPQETLQKFLSAYPSDTSYSFGDAAALAFVRPNCTSLLHQTQRYFCGYDDIYCLFLGSLNNLCSQIKQYGLSSKGTYEDMLVIEAYRTLRDRGPYPADQVIKDFEGSYVFVIYDSCMFHSGKGLMNFEHPMNKMRVMPRVDSEGVMCGANFKVDTYSKVNSIPRVGSEANWIGTVFIELVPTF